MICSFTVRAGQIQREGRKDFIRQQVCRTNQSTGLQEAPLCHTPAPHKHHPWGRRCGRQSSRVAGNRMELIPRPHPKFKHENDLPSGGQRESHCPSCARCHFKDHGRSEEQGERKLLKVEGRHIWGREWGLLLTLNRLCFLKIPLKP